MNSLKTLAEFKRRIRQEELQAGQKNLHGRRFVNWLVQGGGKRKYYAHESGLKKKKMKKSTFRGGQNSNKNMTVNVKFHNNIHKNFEFVLTKKIPKEEEPQRNFFIEEITNALHTQMKSKRSKRLNKNQRKVIKIFKQKLENSTLNIQITESTVNIIVSNQNKSQTEQKNKGLSSTTSNKELTPQKKQYIDKILFFKEKGQNVVTDSADSKVRIIPLSEYFDDN